MAQDEQGRSGRETRQCASLGACLPDRGRRDPWPNTPEQASARRCLIDIPTLQFYFPASDVDFDVLVRTAHRTRCPFKGDATYYAIQTASSRHENAVWCYETPMEEVAGLEGYLAFYPDRVRVHRAK